KSNVLTSTSQGHMNTRTAVAAETLGVQHADLTDQTLVGALMRRGRPATPLVIAAAGNLQQLAQHRYRILLSHRIDRGVLHCDSLTKNAVAFFRISFSIFSRAFSARSLLSSISNSLTGGATLPEELWGVPDPFKRSPRRARRTQFASVLSDISSRRAACGTDSFSCKTRRTA